MPDESRQILLCTDLDRTVLPNGAEPESPGARRAFRTIAARPEVTLCYVTGRHRELIERAIDEYDIPAPDYAIGDVGTSIYEISEGRWNKWDAWDRQIAQDWNGRSRGDVEALLGGITELKPQEPSKQNVPQQAPWTLIRVSVTAAESVKGVGSFYAHRGKHQRPADERANQ